MNTTRHTFSVTHCDNYENTGNCKTLAAAQSLANKHGSQHIFIRGATRTTDTDNIYMVFVPHTGWEFITATEDDFAERATPTDLAETATVYSMDVARVAGRDAFDGIDEQDICERASQIITRRMEREHEAKPFTSPQLVTRYLQATLAHLEHEEFHAMIMDSQHRLIKCVRLAVGTIDGAAVYPREVMKTVLKYNGAAVIFAHNHPSGIADASGPDKAITERLVKALNMIDVRVLDHVIVGHGEFTSFAEKGWL